MKSRTSIRILILRVSPDGLESTRPHDFAKVSLTDRSAGEAVEDIKLLLSPHHKIRPLLGYSNCLLVIDAVTNLRDARDILYDEHILILLLDVVPLNIQVALRTVPSNLFSMLKQLLGLDGASGPSTPQEMQMEAQRLQMMAQMQMEQQQRRQQQQAAESRPWLGTPKPVTAEDGLPGCRLSNQYHLPVPLPKDKMSLIARTIETLHTPPADVRRAAAGGAPRELKRYLLVTISPRPRSLRFRGDRQS